MFLRMLLVWRGGAFGNKRVAGRGEERKKKNNLDRASSGDSQQLQNTGFAHSPVKTSWDRITISNRLGNTTEQTTEWEKQRGDLGKKQSSSQKPHLLARCCVVSTLLLPSTYNILHAFNINIPQL